MQNYFIYTIETLIVIVVPLLYLYLKANWPVRKVILPLVFIPLLWYLAYAPLHELSHAAGIYLVGGEVEFWKLIPSFWKGEFAGAWLIPTGLVQNWQRVITSSFPYLLDDVCFGLALVLFRRKFSQNSFLVGIAFMLLCLRPACDFVFEPIGLLSGVKGDFYVLQSILGPYLIWTFILISIGLAGFAISYSLRRSIRFSHS